MHSCPGPFKRARGSPARPQERFTAWTWTWLAIAGPLVLLVIAGVVATALLQHTIEVDLPTSH